MSKTELNKKAFIRLVLSSLESVSSDKKEAMSYLTKEGLSSAKIISEGLQRIKRLQLQIEASKTEDEMLSTNFLREKAISKVKELLNNPNFSFMSFVRTHELAIQNRNIQSFTEEDIESTLIKYFYLKYLEESKKEGSENDSG